MVHTCRCSKLQQLVTLVFHKPCCLLELCCGVVEVIACNARCSNTLATPLLITINHCNVLVCPLVSQRHSQGMHNQTCDGRRPPQRQGIQCCSA